MKHQQPNNRLPDVSHEQNDTNSPRNGHVIELMTDNTSHVTQSSDGRLSMFVPIILKRRDGRHAITSPSGSRSTLDMQSTLKPLTSFQTALARGHIWLDMLMNGKVSSIRDIAQKEGIDNSYVSRMINLTVLSPDIIEQILNDSLPGNVTLAKWITSPPKLWSAQRSKFR